MCDQVEISLVSLESGKTVLFLNLNVIISNMHIKIYMEIQSDSSSFILPDCYWLIWIQSKND